MSVGKQSNQKAFDHILLPNDTFADFANEKFDKSALALDALVEFADVCHNALLEA
jgi:hypothetical protein